MNIPDRVEFRTRMILLVEKALAIAEASPDARELTSTLDEIVALVEANPDHADTATQVFLGLLQETPGEQILGVPGAIEILEFSMHTLRWPGVQVAMSSLARSAEDVRVSRAAERVLEAFEDDWPGGEIYDAQ